VLEQHLVRRLDLLLDDLLPVGVVRLVVALGGG
jgi:hypothetical protein